MSPPTPTARRPLAVLTGFLGSGKTTLLSRLLRHPAMSGTAVVINELGEIGLDDALVQHREENLVLLASGCVCCTVRGDLEQALRELDERAAAGEIPPFARVVLETTGLADPAPILHTLMSETRLALRFRLDSVVTLVDARHGLATLGSHFEAVKQAAVADRLVLTKCDVAQLRDVEALGLLLERINPAAPRLRASFGEIDPAALFGAGLYDPERRRADVRRWLQEEAYEQQPFGHACDEGCSHARSRHAQDIETFCLTFDEPLDWDLLADALELLTQAHGAQLLRVKGIVHARQSDKPVVIQGVQHVFYPPGVLPEWPDGERRSRIVFITRGLSAQRVQKLFGPLLG